MKKERSNAFYVFKFAYTLVVALVIGGGYFYRHDISAFLENNEQAPTPSAPVTETAHEAQMEKKIKYWVAPMDPTYIRNEPGKSPMGMDLVPVYEDGGDDESGVRISPLVRQNIGVRTAKVEVRPISREIRTVGRVTYDERKVTHIQSKTQGWVEKLYVDFTGKEVKRGDYLLEIYSPELVATQEEYLLALSYRDSVAESPVGGVAEGSESLLEASRRRLALFDVPEHQIRELEETRTIKKTLHIHSPTDGVVVSKNVVAGMQVLPGISMYTVADLARVWVIADIYEYEVPWVKLGQSVTMTLQSLPGRTFHGAVTYIYPYLDSKTRTVQVRMEFDNPRQELKPDMYANVFISAGNAQKRIAVPTEAVIRSGSRNVVVVAKGNGRFEPKDVELGVEGDGYYEILGGLSEGEEIVTSANFLLDSESNLKETINKMLGGRQETPKTRSDAKPETPGQPTPDATMPMDHSKIDHSTMQHGDQQMPTPDATMPMDHSHGGH